MTASVTLEEYKLPLTGDKLVLVKEEKFLVKLVMGTEEVDLFSSHSLAKAVENFEERKQALAAALREYSR